MAQQRQLSEIALDHLAGKVKSANEAREEAARLIAFAEELEAEIKEAMGEHERATVFGVPVFTYTNKNSWALSRFANDYPNIARNYIRVVEKEEIDKDRLLAEQGDLLAPYRTREFRRVNRKPGT